jgi:hypothetical protein
MNVTREVIIDLWPLYESGEASSATRRLVEEYLKQDAEFARLIHEPIQRSLKADALPPLRPERELQTLRRTKQLVWLRDAVFWIAVFLTAAPFAVYNTSWGSGWVVRDHPWLAGGLGLAAAAAWSCYSLMKRRLRATGF